MRIPIGFVVADTPKLLELCAINVAPALRYCLALALPSVISALYYKYIYMTKASSLGKRGQATPGPSICVFLAVYARL